VLLPVGEERCAVARAHNGGEVVLELAEVEALIHDLRHLVAGLHVERDVGDDAQGAEADNCAAKLFAIVGA